MSSEVKKTTPTLWILLKAHGYENCLSWNAAKFECLSECWRNFTEVSNWIFSPSFFLDLVSSWLETTTWFRKHCCWNVSFCVPDFRECHTAKSLLDFLDAETQYSPEKTKRFFFIWLSTESPLLVKKRVPWKLICFVFCVRDRIER